MPKFKMILAIFVTTLLLFTQLASATNNATPIGIWKTMDDVTGKPKAIIQISENQDHLLSGKIIQIFPKPGEDQNERCEACPGVLQHHKIVGLTILNNLHADMKHPRSWIGGSILDPMNGKIYQCNIQLVENNQKLRVRGYLGLPLFGRSQMWDRVTSPTQKQS